MFELLIYVKLPSLRLARAKQHCCTSHSSLTLFQGGPQDLALVQGVSSGMIEQCLRPPHAVKFSEAVFLGEPGVWLKRPSSLHVSAHAVHRAKAAALMLAVAGTCPQGAL